MPPKPAQPPKSKLPAGTPPPIWDVPYDVASDREVVGYAPDGRAVYSRSSEIDEIDEDREDAEKRGLSPIPPKKPMALSEYTEYARKVVDRAIALAEAGPASVPDAYGATVISGDQVTLLDEPSEVYAVLEVAGPNLVLTPAHDDVRSATAPFAVTAARCARES